MRGRSWRKAPAEDRRQEEARGDVFAGNSADGAEIWMDARGGPCGADAGRDGMSPLFSLAANGPNCGGGALVVSARGDSDAIRGLFDLARRYGREDDLEVLDFATPGRKPDDRSPIRNSNTLNPLAGADAESVVNALAALLPKDDGGANSVFQRRAMRILKAIVPVVCSLCESGRSLPLTDMSDAKGVWRARGAMGGTLDIGIIRDFLEPCMAVALAWPLKGDGSPEECDEVARIVDGALIDELKRALLEMGYDPDALAAETELDPGIPDIASAKVNGLDCPVGKPDPGGLFRETYESASFRSGGVSMSPWIGKDGVRLEFRGNPDEPGDFEIEIAGKSGECRKLHVQSPPRERWRRIPPQEQQAYLDQFGYAKGYFGAPLASLSGMYGHLFNVPEGEVDMCDVLFNRRILAAILPSFEKSPQDCENLGKIILASVDRAAARREGDGGPVEIMIVDGQAAILFPEGEAIVTRAASAGFMAVLEGMERERGLEWQGCGRNGRIVYIERDGRLIRSEMPDLIPKGDGIFRINRFLPIEADEGRIRESMAAWREEMESLLPGW